MIDTARHIAAERATERETAAIVDDPQVRHTIGIAHDVLAHQIGTLEDRVVVGDLDPEDEALGAIRRQVHATRAAALTVERGGHVS